MNVRILILKEAAGVPMGYLALDRAYPPKIADAMRWFSIQYRRLRKSGWVEIIVPAPLKQNYDTPEFEKKAGEIAGMEIPTIDAEPSDHAPTSLPKPKVETKLRERKPRKKRGRPAKRRPPGFKGIVVDAPEKVILYHVATYQPFEYLIEKELPLRVRTHRDRLYGVVRGIPHLKDFGLSMAGWKNLERQDLHGSHLRIVGFDHLRL